MSYCVNCGVELDKTAEKCALCNTPVLNPHQPVDRSAATPFPKEKGQVETVQRKDMGIFLTTVVVATAITCGLLNAWAFKGEPWSLAVIGVCLILWVIMVPLVINPGQSIYLSLLYDGAAAAGYLYMLTFLSHSDKWFWGLGLPIVVYVTVIVELTALCFHKLPKSFLIRGICVITAIGFLCAGIEMLIDRYAVGTVELRWSAVVLTVCIIIDIVLITTMSLRRVRAAVRKRLHF